MRTTTLVYVRMRGMYRYPEPDSLPIAREADCMHEPYTPFGLYISWESVSARFLLSFKHARIANGCGWRSLARHALITPPFDWGVWHASDLRGSALWSAEYARLAYGLIVEGSGHGGSLLVVSSVGAGCELEK